MIKNQTIFLIVLIIIISSAVTFYCQYPLLVNKYSIHNDVRQVIYPYLQFREQGLFPGDLITDYCRKWNPWGLTIFYFIVSLFYDPIQFTKILPFFLCGLSAFYMFRVGKILKGNAAGFLAAFMFIFVAWNRQNFEFFGAGGAHDIAIPVFIMFIYYFIKKDLLKTGIVIFFLSIFYPPLLLLSLSIYALSFIPDLFINKHLPRKKAYIFLAAIIIALVVVGLKYFSGTTQMIALKEMKQMEEFYPGGRKPIFFASVLERLTNDESGLAVDYPLKWLLAASFFLVLLLRKKLEKIPVFFSWFLLASFFWYFASSALMYKLYAPARFMRVPLPVFLIFFIALNASKAVETIKSTKKRWIIFSCILIAVAVSFAPTLERHYSRAPFPGLYQFLETLPKDILVAGHPAIMDNVPTFAKRRAFVFEEISLPYYSKIYPTIKNRTLGFFRAYYSETLTEVYEFCRENKITHLVVYQPHFSPDYLNKRQFYLNPFNDYIKGLVDNKTRFALAYIPEDKKLFKEDSIFVIAVAGIFPEHEDKR